MGKVPLIRLKTKSYSLEIGASAVPLVMVISLAAQGRPFQASMLLGVSSLLRFWK